MVPAPVFPFDLLTMAITMMAIIPRKTRQMNVIINLSVAIRLEWHKRKYTTSHELLLAAEREREEWRRSHKPHENSQLLLCLLQVRLHDVHLLVNSFQLLRLVLKGLWCLHAHLFVQTRKVFVLPFDFSSTFFSSPHTAIVSSRILFDLCVEAIDSSCTFFASTMICPVVSSSTCLPMKISSPLITLQNFFFPVCKEEIHSDLLGPLWQLWGRRRDCWFPFHILLISVCIWGGERS